jgi:hypothetical protein
MPSHPFQILDQILTQQVGNPLSLNPEKTSTTSFLQLENLVAINSDIKLIKALADTLKPILDALLQNFPENIFWDFDFLVNSMLRQALSAENDAVCFLKSFGEQVALLMKLFGKKTEIRFRYIHDFMYGFEWAKWVQKQPQTRAKIEPFSPIFLDYLLSKGKEILQRIGHDDVYHQIQGNSYRNPFCFSREPEDECSLLTYLAAHQLIPVTAWNWNAQPIWNKPFHQQREQISLQLGIKQINC